MERIRFVKNEHEEIIRVDNELKIPKDFLKKTLEVIPQTDKKSLK